MKKLVSFLKKPWVIVLLLLAIVIAFFVLRGGTPEARFETETAERKDLREIISELGSVEAKKEASLSFGTVGVIQDILVSEGERVERGQVLARLSVDSLAYQVESARARLLIEELRLKELQTGLTDTEREVARQTLENAKLSFEIAEESQKLSLREAEAQVVSARRALYSTGLTARLEQGGREGSVRTYTPPVISGTYEGSNEGSYEITIYPSNTDTGYSFRYTGIEDGVGSISTVEPEPLGKLGLYIIFPENFARNKDIKWIVDIPNKQSPNYVSLKSSFDSAELAYKNAKRLSEKRLTEAEANLNLARSQNTLQLKGAREETVAAQSAAVSAARSALAQAESSLEEGVIKAPFSGTVATISLKIGSRVSPGQGIFDLVDEKENHIVVYVPESDIARLDTGDTAKIRFDAFRGEEFSGKVSFVSPVATNIQGVTRFKVIIEIEERAGDLKTGISADVDINAEERLNVVAVPSRAVVREDGKTFVRTKKGQVWEKVEVTTGLRSTDGYTEILSGLNEGDEVITYISPQELLKLESEEKE